MAFGPVAVSDSERRGGHQRCRCTPCSFLPPCHLSFICPPSFDASAYPNCPHDNPGGLSDGIVFEAFCFAGLEKSCIVGFKPEHLCRLNRHSMVEIQFSSAMTAWRSFPTRLLLLLRPAMDAHTLLPSTPPAHLKASVADAFDAHDSASLDKINCPAANLFSAIHFLKSLYLTSHTPPWPSFVP